MIQGIYIYKSAFISRTHQYMLVNPSRLSSTAHSHTKVKLLSLGVLVTLRMAEARVAYRELVRAIKTHITANDGNKLWQDYVRKQFRENAAEPSVRRSDKLIQLAKDCAFLINGVQEQRELLLSYNIGIDREVRQRQMIRSTAALVGFKLPFEEGEEEDGM